MSSENLGSELYSGAAGLGRISAIIGAITTTIFSALFITAGVYLITQSDLRGWILILIGILAIIISWLWVYLTRTSKVLAALGGTDELIKLL